MGKYDFRPQRVLAVANQLLETKRIASPPPWHTIIQDIPPPGLLARPVFRDARSVSEHKAARHIPKPGKASRNFGGLNSEIRGRKVKNIFQPLQIGHGEDKLRAEFFGDHPWELARPKVVLEDSGNDAAEYDWSRLKQPGKPLDGESVIQRQLWLMQNQNMNKELAYDIARKEFYYYRHIEDVERRVAREEAMSVGAYFGKGPLEVSMELEDNVVEHWKKWALRQAEMDSQRRSSAYTGNEDEVDMMDPNAEEELLEAELKELEAGDASGLDTLGGVSTGP